MAQIAPQSTAPQSTGPDDAPHVSFAAQHRNLLLGLLSIGLFFAAWQAVFLFVPFNKLFISKPDLIAAALVDLIRSGRFSGISWSAPCRSSTG